MSASDDGRPGAGRPAVSPPGRAATRQLAPGVTVSDTLTGAHGSNGLHQRHLDFTGGAAASGSAGGLGESWYVTSGAGSLEVAGWPAVTLERGTAVWLTRSLRWECRAREGRGLEIAVTTLRAGSPDGGTGPEMRVVRLEDCEPERTGDREFRVLLSEGLAFTQFVGLIPPGRAPAHQHTYDEIVHVLAGDGVVHLGGTQTAITKGTTIYLPPGQPHCLENTGREPLRVLGTFHPAGSPASKQPSGRA